jgi:hypothetical protein
VPINPLRSICVSFDLHVLAEFLCADCTPFVEELLHLLKNEGVSLERSGVMRFLVPKVVPDVLRFERAGEPTQAGLQVVDGFLEPLKDELS